jgi:hypothetical protein
MSERSLRSCSFRTDRRAVVQQSSVTLAPPLFLSRPVCAEFTTVVQKFAEMPFGSLVVLTTLNKRKKA